MSPHFDQPAAPPRHRPGSRFVAWFTSPAARFWLLTCLLVGAGLTRSWIATSRDALQIDEAWHAVAGVSYARTGDYRLNPEHPPLVKLWVGLTMPASKFKLAPFRPLDDKGGEREFIDDAFYLDNDPQVLQHQIRLSMLAFHGLALLGLAWALRRTFGPAMALATTALLLLDPTVAAHLPVVLTDLPLALLSATAVLLALAAFRSWRPRELVTASLALGLALSSKHSAIPVGLAVLALGVAASLAPGGRPRRAGTGRRLGALAGVLLGAYATMWAFYGFRYDESPGDDVAVMAPSDGSTRGAPAAVSHFNRPLEEKIADLQSGGYRAILTTSAQLKLLPRAYLWGLADIIRAGVEGRQDTLYVFGKLISGDTPWYFFPAVLLAKVPLGVLALALLGALLLVRKQAPAEWLLPAGALAFWGAFYLVFVMRGNSGYAGVRHALPVMPVIALLAAVPVSMALNQASRRLRVVSAACVLAACVSALPVMRPWEYYNELVGGPAEAWRYFADDGLENGQRTKDLAAYYDAHVRNTSEKAFDFYGVFENEKKAYKLAFEALEDDPNDSDTITGTVFVNTRLLGERPLYDYAVFRGVKPAARFGNLLVLRGTFRIPWLRAERRIAQLGDALAPGRRDPALAEKLLREITEIYPQDYGAAFELGNLLLERGATEPAREAYALSRRYAPAGEALADSLTRQIEALASNDRDVKPLRSPWLE